VASGPSNGTLTLNADGSFTYTPGPGFAGSDSFAYTADDGNGGTTNGSVSITVQAQNDPPSTASDSYSTDEDVTLSVAAPGVLANDTDVDGDSLTVSVASGPSNGTLMLNVALSVAAPGVLANDTDVDGDSLTVSVASGPSNGTLTLNADGSFDFAPDLDFSGTDSFSYRVDDGNGGSEVAAVTLNVAAMNDAPIAVADAHATDEDVPLSVGAPGVLGNDSDIDNDPLTATLVTAPSQGTVTLAPDGSYVYTPFPDFHGTDAFEYSVHDAGAADTTSVTLTVSPIADAPRAVDDIYSVIEDSTLTVDVPGVMSNDTDADGDPLTAELLTGPSNGGLALNADGSFVYTPSAQFSGTDAFFYTVRDSTGMTAAGQVTITVDGVNDAPVAAPDSFFVVANTGLSVGGLGVLTNDVDADADSLSAVLVTDVAHGALVLNADGSFTYTPAPDYMGVDSFSYRASDEGVQSNAVVVGFVVDAAQVTHEQSASGASTAAASITAQSELVPVYDQLYVAAVSMAPQTPVQSVAGMGLSWTRVRAQCSGRAQTGVEIWIAHGSPTAGAVTATFTQIPSQAVLVVSRYAGVDPGRARGVAVSLNTNGVNGACSGGTDSNTYSVDLPTSSQAGMLLLAAAALDRTHVPGPGFQTIAAQSSGDSSVTASAYLVQKPVVPGTPTLDGGFDAPVDWAVALLEIRPAGVALSTHRDPRTPAELTATQPNPFNAGTTLSYLLPEKSAVEIVVYNVRGQVVRRLVNEVQSPGRKRVYWDARTDSGIHAESGVYFIRVRLGTQTFIRKIISVK
jgi:VCBS repeat-containing protein